MVFDFDFFPLFFVSGPCARLSWPSRQLLSARKSTKSTVSYRIVYRISRLKSSAIFLRRLVPWPSVDIHGKFYGDRPRT